MIIVGHRSQTIKWHYNCKLLDHRDRIFSLNTLSGTEDTLQNCLKKEGKGREGERKEKEMRTTIKENIFFKCIKNEWTFQIAWKEEMIFFKWVFRVNFKRWGEGMEETIPGCGNRCNAEKWKNNTKKLRKYWWGGKKNNE